MSEKAKKDMKKDGKAEPPKKKEEKPPEPVVLEEDDAFEEFEQEGAYPRNWGLVCSRGRAWG
jgi:hypothetical protein|eukprot:SAG25_NODE_670_length_6035_cov_9.724899_3_plen_62_part_00